MSDLNQVENPDHIISGVVSGQVDHSAEVMQFVSGMKHYVRAARMLARVCVAGAELGSDSERDAQSLAHLLGDIEAWISYQEVMVQSNLSRISFIDELIKNSISQQNSDSQD